ncbi:MULTISPECIES: aminodeoxychorismate synthase component I [Terrisporobacter]|uniref:Anthranilate synthase component 1 n=2 Tax=Terrisporobacter TaxID=1505652 RepID=A0A0B3VGE4_9FIRM|nr:MULTISPECIES: aminodeoxychorismate synthase component I [Terrisporobacter]KHS55816.1 aminobenzoate synthetase [Terrisporobacter othiniensis]MCC3668850.1 aminodeoxychorismate synthase component I [Terrisporobacter mayombei]MCR1823293.1 aminodeoxychorismate synthase component I [Terrisporobacter muris]MDU6983906.1 aminodeoxychorismate synthase component I [Terrisporobacter othiniensis]MDY3372555.1 aminodeoxychorismate synthase component I [Terrisporobacter othiniensis]
MIKEIKTKLSAFEIFTLFKDEKDSFILDSAMDKNKLGRYSFISSNPFKTLKYKNSEENPLNYLQEELNKYKVENNTHIPFIGGAVGYLSYDLGNYIEKLPQTAKKDLDVYDLYFGFYDYVIVVDHLEEKTYIATPDLDLKKEADIAFVVECKISEAEINGVNPICYEKKEVPPTRLTSNFTKKEFEDGVEKVRQYIKSGDIYQANLTQRFNGKTTLSSYELYRDLRRISPAPFGAYLNFDEFNILSNSPERFIKCIDGKLETRPIKGTRPRGKNKEEDLKLQEELRNSEKDKAELLMIVDLQRNDIGRISKIGSVKVPELFVIEPYANVNHLVATVVGELDDNKDAVDVIKATFPGGSITGAPKIRAMEIIDELEPTQRNVYTGSIGYIGFNGDMDLNIAIRTIIKKEDEVYFQVGGGMTWGSDPGEEYQETLDKAQSIMKTLRGYYEE